MCFWISENVHLHRWGYMYAFVLGPVILRVQDLELGHINICSSGRAARRCARVYDVALGS